jgi:hypothetical protein
MPSMSRIMITSQSSRFLAHPRYSHQPNIEHQVTMLIVQGQVELHLERTDHAQAPATSETDVLACETIEAACEVLQWHPLVNMTMLHYVLADLKRLR